MISVAHSLDGGRKDRKGLVSARAEPSMNRLGWPTACARAGAEAAEDSAATCCLDAPDAWLIANSPKEASTREQQMNEHVLSALEITLRASAAHGIRMSMVHGYRRSI
jgi:hypothetical protein